MRLRIITLAILAACCFVAPQPAAADLLDQARQIAAQEDGDAFEAIGLLYEQSARSKQQAGDLQGALEDYRIAVTLNRSNRELVQMASALRRQLQAEGKTQYAQGMKLLDAGDTQAARTALLAALHLDPEIPAAVENLKNKMGKPITTTYTIKEGDTLRSISKAHYGNEGAELLLTRINKLSVADRLKPGSSLTLPIVSKKLAKPIVVAAAPAPRPAAPAKQDPRQQTLAPAVIPEPGLTVSAPGAQDFGVEDDVEMELVADAASLLTMARLQFRQELYETVISLTDEILESDPVNPEALDLQRESYYSLAMQLKSRDSNVRAVKMLRRLPKNYKDAKAQADEILVTLYESSNPLYLEGVNLFIAEDLDAAVEKWEIVLTINPYHDKAKSDLAKAKNLLEKLK